MNEEENNLGLNNHLENKNNNSNLCNELIKRGLFGNWRFDVIKNKFTCSKEVYSIFGLPSNGNVSNYQDYLSFVHPDDQNLVQNAFKNSIENNWNTYEIEYKIIRESDNKVVFISEKCIHEKDLNNNITSSIGIIEDITLKKIAEQNEQQFRTIFENAADAIFIADQETGIILNVNRAAERLLKLPKNLIIGKHQTELHPVKQEEFSTNTFQQHLHEIQQEKFTEAIENLVVDADGNQIYVEILASKGIFEGKNSLIGTFRNISERKKVEKELLTAKEKIEESEHKFRAAFYTSPDAININSLEGRYIEINEGFTKLTGYTPEDIIGKLSTEAGIWAIPEDRVKLIAGLKNKGIVENLESIFKTKNGDLVPALMSARIIKLKNEPHILSVTREIISRKKFEKELIEAKEKAEESDRLKTAFIQNMSHEIRTPMNAIMGFSELLNSNFDNKARLNHYSEIINQRCFDLLQIINDLLDIAKIESGQLTAFIESFNIHDLFSELKDTFTIHQEKTKKTGISFGYNLMTGTTIVKTDKLRLKQILSNLIHNSFKFTDAGKIEYGCFINAENRIVFYVSDTGIGIPINKQNAIFERFTKINNDQKRNYGGTGLGLSIVKGLLQLLEGEIWLESKQNEGTTFYFTFKNLDQTQSEDYKEAKLIELPGSNINNKKILIVEDDPFNSAFFDEILQKFETELLHAETGQDAIAMTLKHKPDIILMDIGLPDMSGYEAIIKILSLLPDSLIIAQTAYATTEDNSKAISLGCVDYISKPLKVNQLISIMDKHLAKQSFRQPG